MNSFIVSEMPSTVVLKVSTPDGIIIHEFSTLERMQKYFKKCVGNKFCDVVKENRTLCKGL